MFEQTKIIEKIRHEQEWAKDLTPEEVARLLIPLNDKNSLFLLESPEEDLGSLVREEETDITVYFIPGEELFNYGDLVTINKQELFRFIDVD